MQVIAKFEPNLKTERNLSKLPDQVVFGVAENTLIRKSLTGKN